MVDLYHGGAGGASGWVLSHSWSFFIVLLSFVLSCPLSVFL